MLFCYHSSHRRYITSTTDPNYGLLSCGLQQVYFCYRSGNSNRYKSVSETTEVRWGRLCCATHWPVHTVHIHIQASCITVHPQLIPMVHCWSIRWPLQSTTDPHDLKKVHSYITSTIDPYGTISILLGFQENPYVINKPPLFLDMLLLVSNLLVKKKIVASRWRSLSNVIT